MKSSTIAGTASFGVLLMLLLLLPTGLKQFLQAAIYQIASPLLRTEASVQAKIGGVSGGLKRLDELERDNRLLSMQNDQLRAANSLLRNLQNEVNRLNRALGFREHSSFNLIPAHIISRETATWWDTCIIDRGSGQGVARDMAVVTEAGLVGKVIGVSREVANILLVSDESLRVAVAIEGTQEKGIISGTRASSTFLPDLRIRFLSKTAEIKTGMKVLTTGSGGVFPPEILVGQIKDFTAKQLEGIATVEPAVDLATVQDVFVISGPK